MTELNDDRIEVAKALPRKLQAIIEAHSADADTHRRLPSALVESLRDAGAYRLQAPVERGGFELPLVHAAAVYEGFGRIDASTAWCIWNGNVSFTASILSDEAIARVWSGSSDPIIVNSSGRATGKGVPVKGGYSLTGRWDIISGIDGADWVALFGIVMDGDVARTTRHGRDVRVFFVRTRDIEILDTWHTTGMRGTGSKSVVVKELFVPECLATDPYADSRIDRPTYRVSAFTIASIGSAPIVIGIAQAALDETIALAATKIADDGKPLAHQSRVQSQIAEAQCELNAARLLFLDAAAAMDAVAQKSEQVTEMMKARLRAAMSYGACVSRKVLTTCHLVASSSALAVASPIGRRVRDGMAATQHMHLAPVHMDMLARLSCGLESGVGHAEHLGYL